MIARHVSMKLKADSILKFTRIIESEVTPLLNQQEGFLDQVILLSPVRPEAIVITFWNDRESEGAFDRMRNPEVLRSLLEVIDGPPRVELFEVINTAFLIAEDAASASSESHQ